MAFLNVLDSLLSGTSSLRLTQVMADSRELTFDRKGLVNRIIGVARILSQSGVKPGDRVLLCHDDAVTFLIAFFGCLAVGAVPVSAHVPRDNRNLSKLAAISRDCVPAHLITTCDIWSELSEYLQSSGLHLPRIFLQRGLDSTSESTKIESEVLPTCGTLVRILDDAGDQTTFAFHKIKKDDVAFLQYTSGSTGDPKGIIITHECLMASIELNVYATELSVNDTMVTWAPHHHDLGLMSLLISVCIGIEHYVMSPIRFLKDPFGWMKLLSDRKATFVASPNFALDYCVRKIAPDMIDVLDLTSMRLYVNCSEPVRHDTMERFATAFRRTGFSKNALYNGYGMAEATMFISGNIGPQGWRTIWVDSEELSCGRVVLRQGPEKGASRALVACGQAHLWSTVKIVDHEKLIYLEEGQVGEIWVSGPHIAAGYWNNTQSTQSVFRAKVHAASDSDVEYLRTGDLGFLLDGDLFVVGRVKDTIIIRGQNLYPQDIEAVVETSHPMIRPGCCAAFSDNYEAGERVVVVAELVRGFDPALLSQVRSEVRKAISEEFRVQLHELVLIEAGTIRKTSSGKIQRRATKTDWQTNRLREVGDDDKSQTTTTLMKTSRVTDLVTVSSCKTIGITKRDSIVSWLRSWLTDRLEREITSLDDHSSFSDLGMDSLRAAELALDLGQFVGRSLPDSVAWSHPSVAELARFIETNSQPPGFGPRTDSENAQLQGTDMSFSCSQADGNLALYRDLPGSDLFSRITPFTRWRDARAQSGMWPYSRALHGLPDATVRLQDDSGRIFSGVNFGSIDYLGLSTHPEVVEAGMCALKDFGPHSASVPIFSGNSLLTLQLEQELGELVGAEHVVLFSCGWTAGWGAVASLVRENDHVLLDSLAHNCMQHGAKSATRNLHTFRHLDLEDARAHLKSIREVDSKNGILLVTEGLFSMDSDWPDLGKFQALCRDFGARMLVDVSHDIASMGPLGAGMIGIQNLLGHVDLICGGLSKGLAASGGFLATNLPDVKHYIRCFSDPYLFGTSMSPVSAGCALAAVRIARSSEGDIRRERLVGLCTAMRDRFAAGGVECIGGVSPIVPAIVTNEREGRLACKLAFRRGVIANLVEYPAVPVGRARFRIQLMADHTTEQVEYGAQTIMECMRHSQES